MSQSRKNSHYEITANQIAGIIIGWCLVFFVFPLIGVEANATQASLSSMMFFIASYTRAYAIRRIFNKRAVMRTEDQEFEDLEKKMGNVKTIDITENEICSYPECNCPFDMGADNLCLRGYKNQVTPKMRSWFMETYDHAADDCSVLARWNERFQK